MAKPLISAVESLPSLDKSERDAQHHIHDLEHRLAEAEARAARAERRAWRAEKHVLVAEARARRTLEISRRYRALLANLPDTTLVVFDQDLRYLVIEGSVPWGSPEEIEGCTVRDIFSGTMASQLEELYRGVLNGNAPETEIESEGRSFLVQGVRLPAVDGGATTGMVLSRDITRIKEAEAALRRERETLRKTIEEREVLLREVYHRVKNNLQVVSSLLSLQSRTLSDASARDALLACKQRVAAMGRVHEQLYRSRDVARIDLSEYLCELVEEVDRTFRVSPAVRVQRELVPVEATLEQAIPVGLIAHELMVNAFQHAFPDGAAGVLTLRLSQCVDAFELEVADDGAGMQQTGTRTLGTRLVRSLASQLDADLRTSTAPGQGTVWTLRVPTPTAS